ncbi:MAG: peptide chain release factor N(5)-glutamine methyltransferase [Actinomycetota bacterium]
MSEPRTVSQLLDLGERVLGDSSAIFEDHDNRHEAEQLLAFVLRIPTSKLRKRAEPSKRQLERYLALVARRAGGEPLPLLTGRIEFYGLDLKVRPGVFVPRPSSELIVDRALKRVAKKRRPIVVDVCTGAGPIALAIAAERPDAEVWGADISDEGLSQGRTNAKRLGIDNVAFRRGDLFGPLPARLCGRVDEITAHVPYVPADELDDLPIEVRSYEPLFTLTDESFDGLGLMRRTVEEGVEWLAPGGWMLLEMSEDMATKAKRMCMRVGFTDVRVASDRDGLSVVVESRRSR